MEKCPSLCATERMASTTEAAGPPRQTCRAGVKLDERSTYHFLSRVTVDGVPESFSAASNLPSPRSKARFKRHIKNSQAGQSAVHDAHALKILAWERRITGHGSQPVSQK